MLQFRKLVKKRWLSRIVKIKARSVRLDSLESCFEGMWDPPQKLPHGFLSLGHADVPLATRGIAHSTRTEIIAHSTRTSHIRNSSPPTFHPDISQPQFYPVDVLPSPDISHPDPANVLASPDISHPDPAAKWERRTIQLPRADMSGSSSSAYPENIRSRQFSFLGHLGLSDTRDSPDPFPPTKSTDNTDDQVSWAVTHL